MRSLVQQFAGASAGLIVSAIAAAHPYTSLYVFGDSLFDAGNAYAITGAYPVSPPYAQRFSDGPVASEVLAAHLGLSAAPSQSGGTNYATGSATSGSANFAATVYSGLLPQISLLANHGLSQQIAGFTGGSVPADIGTALVAIWAGANDLFLTSALVQFGSLPADAATFTGAAAAAAMNMENAISTLIGAGARSILALDLPNLGLIPGAGDPTVQALWSLYSGVFNANFLDAGYLGALDPQVKITRFSAFDLFNEAMSDPASFGLTNVSAACLPAVGPLPVGAPCSNPNEYLFWDDGHPTARAHQILGARLFQAVPEPSVLFLLLIACAGLWLSLGRPLNVVKRLGEAAAAGGR